MNMHNTILPLRICVLSKLKWTPVNSLRCPMRVCRFLPALKSHTLIVESNEAVASKLSSLLKESPITSPEWDYNEKNKKIMTSN